MIEIISGTDRPGSNSLKVARFMEQLYREAGLEARLLDLAELDSAEVAGGGYYQGAKGSFKTGVERVTQADGILVIVPEYNGSFPGILKLFIDYWKYPETFEHRPVALIGLGGRWGGLRPVEHLQQVFGYRNGFIFPNRVFISNIKDCFKDGAVTDPVLLELLKVQTRDFGRFIAALKSQKLDANSRLQPA